MCLEATGGRQSPVVAKPCKQNSMVDTWLWHETGEIIHAATNLCLDPYGYDAKIGRLELHACESHVD